MQFNQTDIRSADFTFNRGLTSGPNAATDSTTTGNAIASLLLGVGASGNAGVVQETKKRRVEDLIAR